MSIVQKSNNSKINAGIKKTSNAKSKKLRYLRGNVHSFVLQEQSVFGLSKSGRMKLGFKLGFDFDETNIGLAELDALVLLSKDKKGEYLFSKMVDSGLGSDLVRHLSWCEKNSTPYFLPDPKKEKNYKELKIFKRIAYFQSWNKSLRKNESFLDHHYTLNGGMQIYYIINDFDPYFFKNIYLAVRRGLCSVSRMDLCCDYSDENLMKMVSQNVKLGRCHAYQAQIHGIGVLNDNFFSQRVGVNTDLSKVVKHDKSFILDSLYAGNRRYTCCVVYFYNKSEEQRKRRQVLCQNKTRIEVRFFNKEKDRKYEKVIIWLLYSLSIPRQDEKGGFIRHLIFTCTLFSHISFETTKQTSRSSNSLDPDKKGVWVEWFQDLYEVFLHGCETPWPHSKLCTQHPEFSDLISNFKKDPDGTLEALLGLQPKDLSGFSRNEKKKDFCRKQQVISDFSNDSIELIQTSDNNTKQKKRIGRPQASKDTYTRVRKKKYQIVLEKKIKGTTTRGRPKASKDTYKRIRKAVKR